MSGGTVALGEIDPGVVAAVVVRGEVGVPAAGSAACVVTMGVMVVPDAAVTVDGMGAPVSVVAVTAGPERLMAAGNATTDCALVAP